AAFLPPMIAALFGSSHQLATGPVAVVSLMTATALGPYATESSDTFIAYAILLALIVGVFQLALGLFRLGLVVNFLSHPVINGFTNAAAIIIATSQLSKLFGVYADKGEHHYQTIYNVIVAAIDYCHWPTLALGALAFVIMLGLKRLKPRIPNVLVAVAVTTLISWGTGFEHNREATLQQVSDAMTDLHIKGFNESLTAIERLSTKRADVSAELRLAVESYAPHSRDILDLRHKRDSLSTEIRNEKDNVREVRAALRERKYAAVPTIKGECQYYLRENVPHDQTPDGRVWRLRVGNGQLDGQKLIFQGGGAVVGTIPPGLPQLRVPQFELSMVFNLFPMAVIISLLGFMEAISIAKAMAAKTGQSLDPNQELIGQGLANIVGAAGQSYPVSGSFSRSAVNLQAGAVTGLSSVFSSCVVVITLLFCTGLLRYLPQSVLAAVIMMAVIGLINVRGFVHAWQAQKYDGVISVITFASTLYFAPHLDRGIIIGVVLSIGLFLLRVMKPKIAILSLDSDGAYRDATIFRLRTCRHIAAVRFHSSLFFVNVNYLEEVILERIATMPELKHILVVGNGINQLDASGEELLSRLVRRLRASDYDISFSGLNDSVLDVMRRTKLYDSIGEDHLFRYVGRGVAALHKSTHRDSDEEKCPLMAYCPRE
ncbi:SulP family inorganic anion transporter, partial [Candidatus Sumerlaeota bacterium]